MRIALTISERGTITLPKKLRDLLGVRPADQVIAESTREGILLRPALTLPLERYGDERVREFDAAESDLDAYLSGR